RLDRHDAEVLLAGEDQRPAPPQVVPYLLVRPPAQEAHVRMGQLPQTLLVLPRADDHQVPPQTHTGVDGQVDALVRRKRRGDEVEVLARYFSGGVEVGIDRRIDDEAVTAVALADAPLNGVADGDEMIDVRGRAAVPVAQPRQQPFDEAGLHAA